jgi:hypothetical protein
MLKAYKLYQSTHMQLHLFMMTFFENLSVHRSLFAETLIPNDFLTIAKTHKKVVYNRLVFICDELNKLDADVQKSFCLDVAKGNDIESVCKRLVSPLKLQEIPSTIRQTILDLFSALYSQILRGDNTYSEKYGTIKDHFIKFRELNSNITICPFCGITNLKTEYDKALEQYDHYLAQTQYPLSSVNFLNLVPTCKDCNGLDFKADKNIITIGGEKVFYPYSSVPYKIGIEFTIVKEADIKDWKVDVSIVSEDADLGEEIISWDRIYDIKNRYIAHVKGRIIVWVDFFNEYKRKGLQRGLTINQIEENFIEYIDLEEKHGLNFLRKPVFTAYLNS